MRSSRRPRLATPLPVQTSSLKCESGCFDVGTVLVPSSGGYKKGWVGSAKPHTKANIAVDQSSQSGNAKEKPTTSTTATAPRKTWSAVPPAPQQAPKGDPQSFGSVMDSNKQESMAKKAMATEQRPDPEPEPVREETTAPPPQHCDKSHSSQDSSTDLCSSDDGYVFRTPPPSEAKDEAERERRRQLLAAEQQQMILDRVRAARAAKEDRRKSSSGKKKTLLKTDELEPKAVVAIEKPRRAPRTQGRLFCRSESGDLKEVTNKENAEGAGNGGEES